MIGDSALAVDTPICVANVSDGLRFPRRMATADQCGAAAPIGVGFPGYWGLAFRLLARTLLGSVSGLLVDADWDIRHFDVRGGLATDMMTARPC